MKNSDIDYRYVVVHAPYIINLANNNEHEKYQFSINFLLEEIKRCEALGIHYMVLHPGSHVGIGVDAGIYNIATALNKSIVRTRRTRYDFIRDNGWQRNGNW